MPCTPEQKKAGWVSITELLDEFNDEGYYELMYSLGKREFNAMMKKAGKIGKRIDEIVKAGSLPLAKDSMEVKSAHKAWLKYVAVHGFDASQCKFDEEVRDDEAKLLGHPDFILPDRVIDLKCAARIRWQFKAQIAWYSYITGKPGHLIHLKHTIEVADLVETGNHAHWVNGVYGLLHMYRARQLDKPQGEL